MHGSGSEHEEAPRSKVSSIPGDGGGEGRGEARMGTSGRRKLRSPSWKQREAEKGVDGEDTTKFLA